MKRLLSLILILSLLISLSTGLSITAFAAGETVTATVQGTYTKSEATQDVTIRLQPTGLTGSYCMFAIADGITLPEGFVVQSFSTSYTNQPITNGDYNTDNGQLTYLETGMEDNIPADTYYDMVITAPANAEGQYQIEINTVQIATEYCANMVIEDVDITVPLSINAAEPVVTEYDITIDSNIQNGSVTASAAKAAAGTQVTLTAVPNEGYELKKLTYTKNEEGAAPVDVESGVPFEMPAANITVKAEFGLPYNGYYFTTSADTVPDEVNAVAVTVKVIGHSDNLEIFNAYDLTLTYDEGLIYSDYEGVSSDEVSVTAENGTIRIVGAGANKDIGTNVVTLKFTMAEDATGTHAVMVTAAKVSDRDASTVKDAPAAQAAADPNDTEADDTPDTTVISTKYKVDKPDFVLVSGDAIHGKSLNFWYADNDPTHFVYTDLKVTNGTKVLENLIPDTDGKFTIDEVEGKVLIEVTQSRETYEVEIQTQNANVTVDKKEGTENPIDASYGVDYAFGVTPNENMSISKVTYKIGEAEDEKNCAYDQVNNQYYVPGEDIVGKVTILVEAAASGNIKVEFSGSGSDLVAGGTSQNVPMGEALTVTLNEKKDGYLYSVRVGNNTIAANEDGTFTIPDNLVQAGLKVTVLEAKLVVNVVNYFDTDGKSLFLVKAKATAAEMGENETTENIDLDLAYGKDAKGELLPMYYSNKYTVIDQIPAEDGTTDVVSEAGAFAWLVFTDEDGNAIKTAAMAAITENTDGKSDANNITYDNNVNGSNNIDVNDAQLVYDMYKGLYDEFTDSLTMKKFLEADLSDVVNNENSSLLNTNDVMAIIDYIVTNK